ncbi:fatty acid hydroxylase [Favolaschia claudopus]|uniref:Fatty acid hydroxylase n=1 Tax=Favolaschia claudopus TaxID=2862362 RepID=A0AAW0EI17_9AGAR
MPAFGPMAIKGMIEEMRDICDQLVLKDKPVPFVVAMGDFLAESDLRASRPRILQAVLGTNAKYHEDIKLMKDLAEQVVAERQANPIDKKDMLNTMLHQKDPQSGRKMSAENIARNVCGFLYVSLPRSSKYSFVGFGQLITFLIAGMLTFAVYHLLRNPSALRKVRAEIDSVLGNRPAQVDDLSNLPYLTAVMRETLRLTPTASKRGVTPLQDTTLGGGKYFVKAGTTMLVHVWNMHRDPLVWGEDVEEFRPERHVDGKFEKLPPNAWQPFGFGVRACIGRAFAWQEVILVLATVLQKFDLTPADPSYTLQLKQTLTIKPKGFYIHARRRTDNQHLFYATPSSALKLSGASTSGPTPTTGTDGTPLYVFYGSNTGTSEAFAQRIAIEGPSNGFRSSIGTLDSALGKIPTDGPVVIITASFEGQPADNAAQFVEWVTHLEGTPLHGVHFAVFGCGNSDWTNSFQAIPKLCDELFEKYGAKRLLERGVGDASKGDFFQVFDEFELKLWDMLRKQYSTIRANSRASVLEVKSLDAAHERASILRQPDAQLGRVVENRTLTRGGSCQETYWYVRKTGLSTYSGDYIAILPQNPARDVHRVLAHFGLSNEEEVVLSSAGPTSLPVGKPVKLWDVLAGYLPPADSTRTHLEELKSSYNEAVQAKRLTVLHLLEAHQDIQLPLGAYLQMLPAMRVRQYSISSSPLWNPAHITVTVSVLESPTRHSDTAEVFLGVGSNYLANLRPGDRVQMAVRPSAVAFHPPSDPRIPIVMFCAGAGIAPMRGFIQERAVQKASGRDVGKMLLFFGCRSPVQDFLYNDTDLAEWIKLGVVDVRPAFSRSAEDSAGCKYVQDRILKDASDVVEAYRQNAAFFTCGSGAVAKGIKTSIIKIIQDADSVDTEAASKKFDQILKGRYATDIFD